MTSTTKPKQVWIQSQCYGIDSDGREFEQCDVYFEPVENALHVIEHSAYEELNADYECQLSRAEAAIKGMQHYKAENQRLRELLRECEEQIDILLNGYHRDSAKELLTKLHELDTKG